MALDLAFDAAQAAIGDALAQFCADRCSDEVVKAAAHDFPRALWRELAELGVLALATPEGEGGAVELVAALESLGRAVFPGPLAATFFATQLLPEKERLALVSGEALVAVGTPPLLPWAPLARIFLEVDGERVWRARPRGAVQPIGTLGGESWGRAALERESELGEPARAFALYDVALAAYLGAAGQRLVADASEHARTRTQFGVAIGEFQAVAHPLADCHTRLGGAETLTRAAASSLDRDDELARVVAAAARLSAGRAALQAAFTAHQVFGAVGITLEGPAFHVSRRIQQLAAQPPGSERCREAALELIGL